MNAFKINHMRIPVSQNPQSGKAIGNIRSIDRSTKSNPEIIKPKANCRNSFIKLSHLFSYPSNAPL